MILEAQHDTLQSRGYHMTEKDVQETQDAALGQYMRLKQNAAVAETRLKEVSARMSKVASELYRRDAEELVSFTFESYAWLNPEVIRALAQDVIKAKQEAQNAREKAVQVGVAIPD
jgi:hypothetical protein